MGHVAPSETDEKRLIARHITVRFHNTRDKGKKTTLVCQESGIAVFLNFSIITSKDRNDEMMHLKTFPF